jgi:hypothetical protein
MTQGVDDNATIIRLRGEQRLYPGIDEVDRRPFSDIEPKCRSTSYRMDTSARLPMQN